MLKIENLTKKYGEKKAVDNLSLHIKSGEIYGFIGHNGAGKTTTLKSVVGILEFDGGEIYIDGKSIKTSPTYSVWAPRNAALKLMNMPTNLSLPTILPSR